MSEGVGLSPVASMYRVEASVRQQRQQAVACLDRFGHGVQQYY